MGFSSSALIALRTNQSLRRSNRRLFLDKENDYSADSNEGAVNEIFREALEKENERYLRQVICQCPSSGSTSIFILAAGIPAFIKISYIF